MKEIELTQGYTAIIDDVDYQKIVKHKWHVRRSNGTTPYATTTATQGSSQYMHRMIMGITDPAVMVDHINGNGLDNRRCNLRVANNQLNQANRRVTRNSKTGYKGVCIKHHMTQRGIVYSIHARVCRNGKERYLGTFDSVEEAARAYDQEAYKMYGEFAKLNFPEDYNITSNMNIA